MSKPPYYMGEKPKTCGQCAYAEFVGVPLLECHRHAPSALRERWGMQEALWPGVDHANTCGDFKKDKRP